MSRGVNDVDARALVVDRTVFGEDGDATLALEIVGIHHAFADSFVSSEGARLLEQAVDQRGFAMIDVRDDGDIADRASGGHVAEPGKKGGAA